MYTFHFRVSLLDSCNKALYRWDHPALRMARDDIGLLLGKSESRVSSLDIAEI